MQQLVLRIDDINPDGVRVRINWGAFVVGASFFIPCINVTKGTRQLNAIARSKVYVIRSMTVVENDKIGVRTWRMV